jgi:uncharacterized protein (DUF2062 family)
MSLYRRLRYQVLRLRKLNGSPHSLALGCSIGVFMGIMPVLPLRSILIALVSIPSGANLIAAFVVGSVIIANPFVLVVWYSAALACGNLLVADAVTWERVSDLLDNIRQAGFTESLSLFATIGWDMVFVLLAGGLLIALPAGIASYLVALRYFSTRNKTAPG